MIPRSDPQRSVAEHLGQRPCQRRHDGYPDLHGLQRRKPEPLVERGIGQDARPGEQCGQVGIRHPTRPNDPVARCRAGDRSRHCLLAPPRRPRQHECNVGHVIGERVEGPHQTRQVFARLGRADREAVPANACREHPFEHRGGIRLGRDRQRGNAGMYDPDAGGFGVERVHDLVCDEC